LRAIQQLLEQLINKPASDFWQGDFYVVAVVSAAISLFGVYTIIHEFSNDRIDEKCQINLLKDLVRHLYRNKVCTLAMQAKYNVAVANAEGCYPSEEHYRKQQLLPEDIHIERYNHHADIYDKLHDLEMKLRNYNTEIEVAEMHMSNPNVDAETKKRDFETLDFKTGFLTVKISEVLSIIESSKGWFGDTRYRIRCFLQKYKLIKPFDSLPTIRKIIKDCFDENLKNNKRENCQWGDEYLEELSHLRKDERTRDNYFTEVFKTAELEADDFANMLSQDLLIECGRNIKGEEKIHIIQPLT